MNMKNLIAQVYNALVEKCRACALSNQAAISACPICHGSGETLTDLGYKVKRLLALLRK